MLEVDLTGCTKNVLKSSDFQICVLNTFINLLNLYLVYVAIINYCHFSQLFLFLSSFNISSTSFLFEHPLDLNDRFLTDSWDFCLLPAKSFNIGTAPCVTHNHFYRVFRTHMARIRSSFTALFAFFNPNFGLCVYCFTGFYQTLIAQTKCKSSAWYFNIIFLSRKK